ncbi:tyrosine-type recombinase/integrase [Neobacillus niacini]|uniref:tyrosine-type recombinase/integrase n=1 Tax=Neobacillus niacini TaxID=86668 RepID=UPI0012FABBE8|nr:tyrosine-type recombinase/integrase [Neobacillus niacini]MEC1523178.1 tyrosine-type recombinase/integrase [Neobacillus niacini]
MNRYRRMTITKSAYVDEEGKVQIRDLTKDGKDRTIVIGKKLMNVLKNHYDRFQELKDRLGESFNPNGLVFFNSNGDYTHPRELHRIYKRSIKQAGLKHSRFHDTRHSHASILLQKNVHPKIISKRLGHSKNGITLDLYSHAIPSLQEQAVEVFGDIDDNE